MDEIEVINVLKQSSDKMIERERKRERKRERERERERGREREEITSVFI